MVFIKDFLSMFQVEVIFGKLVPRKLYNIFKVVMLNSIFCHLRIHSLKFSKLFFKCLFNFLRPFFLGSFFFKDLDIYFVRRTAELFLDSSKLLVKEIFALLFIHIHLNLVLNLVLQLNHLHLVSKNREQLCSESRDVVDFEKTLFFLHRLDKVTCDEVNHKPRAVDVFQSEGSLERNVS